MASSAIGLAEVNLSDLNGTNGFTLDGEAAGQFSGSFVSGAGDVNGDGYDDMLVGAHLGNNPNGYNAGRTYVVFGSPDGFPAHLPLSSLDGTNGFKFYGERAGDLNGFSVSRAGDVNGDGIDDLIVGSLEADPNGYDSGSSYVVFGTRKGFPALLSLAALDGTNGFAMDGEAAGDKSGLAASGAGDVNADGIDDVIVGAVFADPSGAESGRSYVVFGTKAGFPARLALSALDGANGFKLDGEGAGDQSGIDVSGAGDVNGDGIDDLIVGANGADPAGRQSGRSYVVFGSTAGFAPRLSLASLDGSNGFKLDGEAAGDDSGWSVVGAEDVNGDGIDDVIVGAPRADPNGPSSGRSYVVFGSAAGFPARLSLSALDGTNGFKLDGEVGGDLSGPWVSGAGDMNADGFGDLIIGARGFDANGADSGRAYVVYGAAGGFPASLSLASLNGTNGFKLNGERAGDLAGNVVSGAGDVNGDGFDDVIIGANRGGPGGYGTGRTYVVYGFGAGGTPAETVTVRLGGTGGPDRGPAFRVWADGEIIGQGVVDDPQTMAEFRRFGRDWTDFTFAVDAAPETVEVEFLNDGRDPGTGEDVNLFVDSVSFGGEVYQAENYGWFTPRNGNPAHVGPRENLWWNGRLSFSERGDPEPGDLLFADDFVIYDKLSPEWTVVHPNAWIEDGWLHLQDRDGGARNALISTHDSDPGWTDYSVRCTVDFMDIGWVDNFDIALRVKGFDVSSGGIFGSGYQLFGYGPTGWEVEKRNTLVLYEFVDPDTTDRIPGVRTELLRVRHDLPTEPFEVIASVEGGQFRAWVDGELLIDHLDSTPRDHGGIALGTMWELHTRYDDVEVVAGSPEDAGWLL